MLNIPCSFRAIKLYNNQSINPLDMDWPLKMDGLVLTVKCWQKTVQYYLNISFNLCNNWSNIIFQCSNVHKVLWEMLKTSDFAPSFFPAPPPPSLLHVTYLTLQLNIVTKPRFTGNCIILINLTFHVKRQIPCLKILFSFLFLSFKFSTQNNCISVSTLYLKVLSIHLVSLHDVTKFKQDCYNVAIICSIFDVDVNVELTWPKAHR